MAVDETSLENAREPNLTPFPGSRNSPPDVSNHVGQWLRSAQELADLGSQEISAEIQAIAARWRQPSFRLAFVGQFSRGKSTLLNRLLNQSLLPVGVLPTTATTTFINGGKEPRMEVLFPDGRQETRALEESSWDDLIADNHQNEQNLSTGVRVTLNDPWLQAIDVELVDTPGAGDSSPRRAALIFELLNQCDAVVLLVSATLPFSMTEATFLEREIFGRHISSVLVAVSKLDTVAEEERVGALLTVQERVSKISSTIPVLPLHPVDSSTTRDVLAEVRSTIEKMLAKQHRRAWRSRQVAEQIVDCLGRLTESGETAISAIQMSAAQRENALQKLREEIERASLDWEKIRLEVSKRRLLQEEKLGQELNRVKQELNETFNQELKSVPDLKAWWEQHLPARMQNQLLTQGRRIENSIATTFVRDVSWMQEKVNSSFAAKLDQKPNILLAVEKFDVNSNHDIQLIDSQTQRLLSRIAGALSLASGSLTGSVVDLIGRTAVTSSGIVATGVATGVVAGGIPLLMIGATTTLVSAAANVGVGLLAEQLLYKSQEKQKRLLTRELESRIDKALNTYSEFVSNRLRELYDQLIDQVQKEQSAWCSRGESTLKASSHAVNESIIQELLNKISVLKEQILAELK